MILRLKENLPWITHIKECLEKNGMMSFYNNSYENKPPFIHKRLFQNLSDSFHQDAFCNISNPESKLRTYGLLKKSIGIESYLTHINNPEIRRTVTKFRLSNHRLNIETRRHKNIPKELRFCHFCRNTVESELHFLIECPTYRILRKELINMTTTKKPFFAYYTQIEKFQYLLSDENIRVTSRYIHSCLEIREFLIKHPKRRV